MTLAISDRHPLLPHVESWAEELGPTAPEAIASASQPTGVIDRQQDLASRQLRHEAADRTARHSAVISRTRRVIGRPLTQFAGPPGAPDD